LKAARELIDRFGKSVSTPVALMPSGGLACCRLRPRLFCAEVDTVEKVLRTAAHPG